MTCLIHAAATSRTLGDLEVEGFFRLVAPSDEIALNELHREADAHLAHPSLRRWDLLNYRARVIAGRAGKSRRGCAVTGPSKRKYPFKRRVVVPTVTMHIFLDISRDTLDRQPVLP
jgi:hypothetical protein